MFCVICDSLSVFGLSDFRFPDMALLYETLTASSVLKLDQKVLDSMRVKIDEELKKLDDK